MYRKDLNLFGYCTHTGVSSKWN